MKTSTIWRFSLFAAAVPWAALSACGGRTGDYDLPDGVDSRFSGGAANGSPIGSSDVGRGGPSTSGVGVAPSKGPAGPAPGRGSSGIGPGFGAGGVNRGGGGVLPPPPTGAGGSLFRPPPIGAGGTVGIADASIGGSAGLQSVCFPPNGSFKEVCMPPTDFAVDTCCTASGHCGVQLLPEMPASSFPIAGGCQQMNQPGFDTTACPDLGHLSGSPNVGTTIFGCCRPDGTCGLDLALVGVGCVQTFIGGKPIFCGDFDAGPPPVDAGPD